MEFKKAVRRQVKLKLAITGPTGSGKTYSALMMAKGMGGKIAVIDTENGSASLYSDKFDFDVLEIKPPFTTEKYIQGIDAAEKAGYDIIIIDSLTHAWAGEGGLLEQKAQLDARPGSNHWTNWGPIDKKDAALKNAFLHSPVHIIATMRSKMDYAQADDNGKKKIQKLGMAPIQRDGLSYEFTTVFDIAMNNEAEVSKDRTGIFAGNYFKITEETGKKFVNWMNSGAELIPEEKKPQAEPQQQATPPVRERTPNPRFATGRATPQTEAPSPAALAPQPTEDDVPELKFDDAPARVSHPIFEEEKSEEPTFEYGHNAPAKTTEPKPLTLKDLGDEGAKKLRTKLLATAKMTDWSNEQITQKMKDTFKVNGLSELTTVQFEQLHDFVKNNKPGLIGGVIHEHR